MHRSHRRGWIERLLTLLGGQLRRCHDCRLRQAWFRAASIPLGHAERESNLAAQVVIASAGLLLCLAFVWWVIQRAAANAG